MKELNAKYVSIEGIFEGQSGAVYKARDDESGADIAIKILKQDGISGSRENIAHFSHELDILSGISHPGVLKIFEHGYLNNDIYIVSEYVGYPSLDSLFRSQHKFPVNLIIDIFIQLAEALSFLHKNKIIHRCLKPSHILVHFDDNSSELHGLKIIGCAVSHIKKIITDVESQETESLLYMSPEQMGAGSSPVDERSDLYSLGVIMYTMCAGIPSFQGNSFSGISYRKITQIPPGPSLINNTIPEVLDHIIMKLISSEAENRYHNARGLLEDLLKIKSGEREFLPGLADRSYKVIFHTQFIGRDREMAQLKEAHYRSMTAKGGLCLIRGNPGVGKTRFVNEFSRISDQGIFLRGKCYSFEKNEPYSPFKEALYRYEEIYNTYSPEKKQITKDHIKKSAGGVGDILIRFSPFLYEIMGDSPILVKLDPDKEKKRVLYALALFFLSLSKVETGLTLFLDDLQWLDDDGFDLLHELVHSIVGYPFLIIGAYRDTEVGPGHRLERFANKSIAEQHALTSIHLKPFEREHLDLLIEELFHDSGETVKRVADAIYLRNSGNPFYTIEAVRELIEKDIVYYQNKWIIKEEDFAVSSAHTDSSTIEHIVKSLTLFTETEREIFSCAAISGIRFSPELLYYYNTKIKKSYSTSKIKRLIEKAVDLHLIEEDSSHKGFYIFSHDRIQESLIDAVHPEMKKILHQLTAEFLLSHRRDSIENYYYDLVNHYTYTGDSESLLTYSRLAGIKARTNYAYDEAVLYFETALSILGKKSLTGSALWLECMEQAAELYLIREEAEKSIMAFSQLLKFTTNKNNIVNIYLQISLAYLVKSINYKESEKYAKIGLRLLGERLPVKKSLMPFHLLKEFIVRLLHAFLPALFIRKETKEDERMDKITSFYYVLSWIYAMSDKMKFARNTLRILNLCERYGPSKNLGMANCTYGLLLMALKVRSRALEYLCASIDMYLSFQDNMGAARSYYILGIYYQWSGQYDLCLENLHKSMNIYSWIGAQKDVCTILLIIHRIYIDIGEHDKALTYIHELKTIGYKMQNRYNITSAFFHQAIVAYQQGDYNKALQLLNEALDTANAEESQLLQCSVYFRLGAVYLELGDFDKSLSMSRQAERLYKITQPLTYYSSELFCRIADAYIVKYKAMKDSLSGAEKRKLINSAGRYSKKAMRIAGKWPTHRGYALRLRAEYFALKFNAAKAKGLYNAAIEQCIKINLKYDLAMAYYSYGNFLNELNEDAGEYWHRAYIVFSSINSAAYIGKLKSLLNINDAERAAEAKSALLKRQAEAISSFTQLVRDISVIDNRQEILDKIVSSVLKLSGAQRVRFFSCPDEDAERPLRLEASGGIPSDKESDHIMQKIALLVLKKQKIINSDEAVREKNLKDFRKAIQSIKSILCIPVSYRNQIKAVLYLDNCDSSFSVHEEILPVINAFLIQAVTEIALNSGTIDKKNKVNQQRFDYLCESSHITSKEKQVLLLLLKGNTKKQIAEAQSISINTVKHHISNIYEKTHATSREELAQIFILPKQKDN